MVHSPKSIEQITFIQKYLLNPDKNCKSLWDLNEELHRLRSPSTETETPLQTDMAKNTGNPSP